MNNLSYRVLGIVLILSGISVWLNPIKHSGTDLMTFDYTEIQIPMCMFLIIIGSAFIWSTFRKKAINYGEMVCVNCKAKYKAKHVQINICPKCDGKLVEYKCDVSNS